MITSTNNVFEVAAASGTDTDYTFPYPIHKSTDLLVYVNGAKKLVGDTAYAHTVTVAADKGSAEITFSSAPAENDVLKFERELEYKQETDLANNSLFDAESLETSLDNIVMQVQQVGIRSTDLVFGFDPGIAKGDYNNSDPQAASTLNKNKDDRKNKGLKFDANGDITVSLDDLDTTIDYQLEAKDWASKASGNVNTYTGGSENSDGTAISAKAQATAAAQSASDAAADLAEFQGIYRGASSSTPGTPADGNLWFDTSGGVDVMKVYNATGTAWEQLTPSSANQTNINSAVSNATNINKVAAIDGDVTKVADIDTDVTAVKNIGTNGADVTTVANITAGDISKVANITTGDVSKVANITTGDVSKVANITTGDVSKVAAVDTKVSDVADIDTEITTIVTGTDGTASTGGSNTNLVLINSVHGKITEVGRLGTADAVADLAILGTNDMAHATTGYIKKVSDIEADVTKVGAIDSDVTKVAAIGTNGADVTTVANIGTNGADVSTVAALDDEIGRLGAPAMSTASTGHLALLGTTTMADPSSGYLKLVGDIDDKITTVANNITDVDNFADLYQIHDFASTPTQDGGGNPIAEGDLAYDSTANVLKVWNGSSFAAVSTVTILNTDTSPELGGNLDVKDKVITTTTTNGHIAFDKGITEKVGSSSMPGASTVVEVDLSTGNFFEVDLEGLSGNVATFTISNVDATSQQVNNFLLKIIQGTSTTTRNFTWATIVSNGTNIDWAGGSGPDITTGNDKVDILSFTSYDNGTTWYGAIVGQDFS